MFLYTQFPATHIEPLEMISDAYPDKHLWCEVGGFLPPTRSWHHECIKVSHLLAARGECAQ